MSAPFFASAGFDNIVCANRVLAIITPRTRTAKTFVKAAKDAGTYLDVSLGKTIKSVILFDNGYIILSHISPQTLRFRFSNLHKPKPWKSSEEFNEAMLGEDDVSSLIEDETEEEEEDEMYGEDEPLVEINDDDGEAVHELP